MLAELKIILEVQELDMKMIRLMRVKKERLKELQHIEELRKELRQQQLEKEKEIFDLSQNIIVHEAKIRDIQDKIKRLEGQQSSVRKVDEFNALTQEMTQAERERVATEQFTSDLIDKRNIEEEILQKIKQSLLESEEGSRNLENEIVESIRQINHEGKELLSVREKIAKTANPEVLRIYQRLINNKQDRVLVPIENRTCSGCHISLTAQHENSVRKGERLIFCEHCSRMHYWLEAQVPETSEEQAAPKRRRRRAAT